MQESTGKRCPKCSETKPLAGFNRDRSRRDGLSPWCKECDRKKHRRYRENSPDKDRQKARRYYEANHSKELERVSRYRGSVREAVFNHYGRSCGCCGATDDLTIDHVNGDGREHRAEIGQGSSNLYRWLVMNGFPKGFAVLCGPCNRSKGAGVGCRLSHIAALSRSAGNDASSGLTWRGIWLYPGVVTPDELDGKRTGERIQILRERRGLTRPVLAGLVGMSPGWLKGIERGSRLPPRLPLLVKLAEALAVGDVAILAGTDMDLGGASVPVGSFARVPHDAVPAIREAVRAPLLVVPAGEPDVTALASRAADAWVTWHQSAEHRTDVGRVLPRLVTDARIAARASQGPQKRAANAVLADVYALVQHEVVWASETELSVTAADRAMTAGQEADNPLALAGAAWTLGMVQRSAGDTDGALALAADAAGLLEPRLEDGSDELRAMYGALQLHAATTAARAGREGDAWRAWDIAEATARRLGGYYHPWTMFGTANVKLHAVSISADLSKSAEARGHAEQVDPAEIPSRERRGRLCVEIARAYHQRRDYPAALHWLEEALSVSRDSVQYSPTARQMAADVVDHGGPLISRRARSLAGSIGLPL